MTERLQISVTRGAPRKPCHDCGGIREGAKRSKLYGLRDGKDVPLCLPCKAKPSEKRWLAVLPQRFWHRRFPGHAAAGFRDAMQGVFL